LTICSADFNTEGRLLGLLMDENVNFSAHIDVLSKKNSVSYCIKVLKKYSDYSIIKTIYYGVFIANLKFSILFWGGASDINKIFVIQKHVFRVIHNIPFRESCRGKFKINKMLTVIGLYIYECLVFNFKYKEIFFNFRPNHSTRTYNCYNFPNHRLSMMEKGPCYASIKFFNSLPNRIKNLLNLKNFKREVFKLLVEIEPYTIREFHDYFSLRTIRF
jgi:hypothetical protein